MCIPLLVAVGALASTLRADEPRVIDPTRPVTEITRTSVALQWFTDTPTRTRVQVREGQLPLAVIRGGAGRDDDPWGAGDVRVVEGPPGTRTFHRLTIGGLEPGSRYLYRVWAPHEQRTASEAAWGADAEWRREFAVSTLAPPGRRTVIRYPVKVLLMPNVVNVASATADAPHPEPVDAAFLDLVRAEFDAAARFLYVNSHMRFWPDFQLFIDDRWQRWGPEVPDADAFYRGWPVCRSYDGVDYRSPGGGRFTFVDTDDLATVHERPIVEADPFPGQIEVAFPRRWRGGAWEFYTSGGGTLGVESIAQGIPGRSQFLGGHDTAWLATHEFHHQMESLGQHALSFREDDRIVYNHWAPRDRARAPDAASGPEGDARPHPWTTSAKHGEHWDGMAYWDRTLTDAQWLRINLGRTITVADADADGFPDHDPRLPLDETRFGSSLAAPATDGRMNDLDKAMLSTWAPAPLHRSVDKPRQVFPMPDPTTPDSDADGWPDTEDPAPLVPHEPFVWPAAITLDGDPADWAGVPPAATIDAPPLSMTFKHAHTDDDYYALIELTGAAVRARVVLDGEGKGTYSGEGVQAFHAFAGDPPRLQDTAWGTAGLTWKASRLRPDRTVFEIRIANWAPGGWFWKGAGREIGVAIDVMDADGGLWAFTDPYRMFYCRMLERSGLPAMPPDPPAELAARDADAVLLPGDARLALAGGWTASDGAWRHAGAESPAAIHVPGAVDFDLWIRFEGTNDAILGAFVDGQPSMSAMHDYLAFVGGYANTRSRFRLFGLETAESAQMVEPGVHTMQLSRRDGRVWVLWNGRPILWAKDPTPGALVDRLAILGGYGGHQVVHEVRYRARPAAP